MKSLSKLVLILVCLSFGMAVSAQTELKHVAENSEWTFSFDEAKVAKVPEQLKFTVVCDASTMRVNGEIVVGDTGPVIQPGSVFSVTGYVYPRDLFTNFGPEGGVLVDFDPATGAPINGRPEWPDLVTGIWHCRGFFEHNRLVVTNQVYDLNPAEPGTMILTSDGYEPFSPAIMPRAVTGGTGKYKFARGEVEQRVHGFNPSGAPNFSFDFIMWPGKFPFKAEN